MPLHFGVLNDAEVSHFLSIPTEVDLYSADDAERRDDRRQHRRPAGRQRPGRASCGSSMPSGTPLALDDQQGGDPQLTFQAATAGTYYIGVSSAPNDDYNPTVADSGIPGGTTGLYTLDVTRSTSTPLCRT